jgi:hypothetical protein
LILMLAARAPSCVLARGMTRVLGLERRRLAAAPVLA